LGKIDIPSLYADCKKTIGLDDPKPISWVLPTGSLSLDRILGVGGYPGGRIIELFGPESGGKTTMAMSACVEAERINATFAYVDMEQSLDLTYFARMGLKGKANKEWMHITPETGEDAFKVIEKVVRSGVNLVVVDSVAAMVPQVELQGEYGDSNMGLQARMMSQGMRKLVGIVGQCETVVIFINQTRTKIGIVYGNPETTTGGNALKFYSSVRIRVQHTSDKISDSKGQEIGIISKLKTIKNKVSAPMREAVIPIIWGKGIDQYTELFNIAVIEDIIKKSSSYYTYKDIKVNGKQAMIEAVMEVADEIREDLNRKWSITKDIQENGL
jgi:recombination protein RecA